MFTLEEKLSIIESSASFTELNKEVLPKVHHEDYYFVSYSHKDYKRVIKDILMLEENGVNVWYDSDMHIGENWEYVARYYISKFQCKGIIFYLSENSILSPACNKEIEYVLENDKQFFSINIPLTGEEVATSGLNALKTLKARGAKVSKESISLFERAFSNEILYLDINESIDRKLAQIEKLKGEPLFDFDSYKYQQATLTSCKDNSLVNIDFKSNYQINCERSSSYGEYLPLCEIDPCVFANSYQLLSVRFPSSMNKIGESAFRNCYKLKSVNLDMPLDYIEASAFFKCSALNVDKINCKWIDKFAFAYCNSLKEVAINAFEINNFAFAYCKNLKKIKFGRALIKYGDKAFSNCESLTEIKFKNGGVNLLNSKTWVELGDDIFENTGFENFALKGKVKIDTASGAFSYCKNLQTFEFELQKASVLPSYFFTGSSKLKTVSGLENFSEVGESAFYNCESFENGNLSNIKKFEEKSFACCSLKEVELTNAERIERCAFAYNELKKITLGEKVNYIGYYAFGGCENIEEIYVYSENVEFLSPFGSIEPKTVLLKNESLLEEILLENGKNIQTVYFPCDKIDEEYLQSKRYAEFEKAQSDIEGFDKFILISDNVDCEYYDYLGKKILLELKDGTTEFEVVENCGVDKETGESYIEGSRRYYKSEILNIMIRYSLF